MANVVPESLWVCRIGLVDRAVDEAGVPLDEPLVGQDPSLSRHDDARQRRITFVRREHATERDLRRIDLLDVQHDRRNAVLNVRS